MSIKRKKVTEPSLAMGIKTSATLKLPMIPNLRDSSDIAMNRNLNGLTKYQSMLMTLPASGGSLNKISAKGDSDSADDLREFFTAVMPGHPLRNSSVELNPVAFASSFAKHTETERAKIYAINQQLRDAEKKKFSDFILSQERAVVVQQFDDSDSENSCFENIPSNRKIKHSSKNRALVGTISAVPPVRSLSSGEPRVFRAVKKKMIPDMLFFGGV